MEGERHYMRAKMYGVVLGSAICILSAHAAETNLAMQGVTTLRLSVDLVDGSRLIGIPGITNVPVQTSYAKMDVPLMQIRTMKIGEDHETVTLNLRNGDTLTGVISLKPIELKTLFGTISVGIEHIKEIVAVLSESALPESLQRRLVLYYSFDRDEGAKVTDGSGKRNDGEVHGAKWIAKGIRGGAYQFDGNDDHIDSMNASLANGFSEVTLSVWAYTFANSPHAGIATACFPNGKASLMISEGYADKRQATFYVGNGTRYDGVSAVPIGVLAPETWHHLAGIWKSPTIGGDGLLRMYFDGMLSSTSTQPLDGAIAQTTSLKIGWDDTPNQPDNRRFNGIIDEVMIFDHALTERDVRQIYDGQKGL
jgi:hypothetical protein